TGEPFALPIPDERIPRAHPARVVVGMIRAKHFGRCSLAHAGPDVTSVSRVNQGADVTSAACSAARSLPRDGFGCLESTRHCLIDGALHQTIQIGKTSWGNNRLYRGFPHGRLGLVLDGFCLKGLCGT